MSPIIPETSVDFPEVGGLRLGVPVYLAPVRGDKESEQSYRVRLEEYEVRKGVRLHVRMLGRRRTVALKHQRSAKVLELARMEGEPSEAWIEAWDTLNERIVLEAVDRVEAPFSVSGRPLGELEGEELARALLNLELLHDAAEAALRGQSPSRADRDFFERSRAMTLDSSSSPGRTGTSSS